MHETSDNFLDFDFPVGPFKQLKVCCSPMTAGMANHFAREQLLKYGWTEGKGLGKDENGITEPVKLATNQDKAGIGYDEAIPAWEKMFDDTAKQFKVMYHGDEVSLSRVNDTNASYCRKELLSEKFSLNKWKTFVPPIPDPPLTEPRLFDLNTSVYSGKMEKNEIVGYRYDLSPLSGKLKRIAEQDRILLDKSLSDPTLTEWDLHDRRDIFKWECSPHDVGTSSQECKKNEHETNNIEIKSQSDGNILAVQTVGFKSTKNLDKKGYRESMRDQRRNMLVEQKDRRKVNMLEEQLRACILEENRHDFLNKKLCQKMKKTKEKKDSILISNRKLSNSYKLCKNYIETMADTNSTLNQATILKTQSKTHLCKLGQQCPNSFMSSHFPLEAEKQMKCVHNFNTISQLKSCGNEKDSNWHKIELSPELKNSIEGNEVTDKRHKDWVTIDLEAEKQRKDDNCYALVPMCRSMQDVSKSQNITNCLKKPSELFETPEEIMRRRILDHKLSIAIKKHHQLGAKELRKIFRGALKTERFKHELNSVIQDLTSFGLTEEVNANTIKKKPTQTHLTPV